MSRRKRIIYLPIEPYKERATEYQSVEHGLYETLWAQAGIDFLAIRPDKQVKRIETGLVLDTVGRARWGFAQVTALLTMMKQGQLDPDRDVIYNEDFWLPGFEMIPYNQCLLYGYAPTNHIPVYSYSHAQTPDPHDFTHSMQYWMRDMERGWLTYNTGVFCAAREMIGQFLAAGMPLYQHKEEAIGETVCKMHVVGHPWDSATVLRVTNGPLPDTNPRKPQVIYSSRWDSEKNPVFFLDVAYEMHSRGSNATFHICTGSDRLKSNQEVLLQTLADHPGYGKYIFVHTGLSKAEYFKMLSESAVQFNCASQDFVSYTLLEAAMYNCFPLYPRWLTFPHALCYRDEHLYTPGNLHEACDKLEAALHPYHTRSMSWVLKPHFDTVSKMTAIMGF